IRRHRQKLFPAGRAEFLERVEFTGLEGGANLVRRQVGLPINLENPAATALGLRQNVDTRHQSNATQNSVEGHKLFWLVEGMDEGIDSQAQRLLDEFAVEGLAHAKLPFSVGADSLRVLREKRRDDGCRGARHRS